MSSSPVKTMSILQEYVRWARQLEFDCIPKAAISAAKNAIIDTLAAMLCGVNEPVTQKLLAYQAKECAAGTATVAGSSYRFSPASAALANGTMAHALDFDDILTSTRSHPSAVLVPCVLAVGESLQRSGAKIVTAYLAGIEAIDKIGSLVAFAQYAKGWHTTSTLGVLGAAASAGKLLNLSAQQLQMAFGIAASMAGGLQINFGTMTKPLHAGWAAQSGIIAAMLAADGFTASEDVLSGEDNYLQVLGEQGQPKGDLRFGAPFATESPGLYVKRYPCCFATHRALDAVFNIRSEFPGINPEDILSVTCMAPVRSFTALIHDSPQTGLEGKFSMQYTISAAFIDGCINVHSFTDSMVQRDTIRSLMPKVRKIEDPALSIIGPDGSDRRFTEVTMKMRDGQVFNNRVVRPKGSADVPLTEQEMTAKFIDCSSGTLTDAQQRKSIAMIRCFESVEDISELMANLRVNHAHAK